MGIVLVAVSVVVMPFLSYAQRRAGQELGSATAVADSKETLLCTYLYAAVLVGLALNAARMFSDTFAGIAPASAIAFVGAELSGAALGTAIYGVTRGKQPTPPMPKLESEKNL